MGVAAVAQAKLSCRPAHTYVRRQPERSVLYGLVQEHLETFLEEGQQRSEHGFGYPRYVEQTFRRFLQCGVMSYGCVKLHCASCGHDVFVAFSCKGRGFCPSCQARRMSEVAATLVDGLLPQAPYRQWVFTYPVPLRLAMARDGKLLTAVLQRSLRTLAAYQRRKARRLGLAQPLTAALCAVHRFGSAINLNVHAHVVAPDGVFVADSADGLRFEALAAPTDAEVAQVALGVQRRVTRLVQRRADEATTDDEVDTSAIDHALREVRAPRPLAMGTPAHPPSPRCANVEGFGVHANVQTVADDRAGLEHLVRYTLRPPLAHQRLERLPSGRIRYQLRRPWYDGSTHLEFEPLALMRRLALQIPPPRQHTLRYHGLFAPNAKHRKKLTALLPPSNAHPSRPDTADPPQPVVSCSPPDTPATSRRLRWAQLLRRVFHQDLERCPKCSSPLELVAVITETLALRRLLTHLGLPTVPTAPDPARLPPQTAVRTAHG